MIVERWQEQIVHSPSGTHGGCNFVQSEHGWNDAVVLLRAWLYIHLDDAVLLHAWLCIHNSGCGGDALLLQHGRRGAPALDSSNAVPPEKKAPSMYAYNTFKRSLPTRKPAQCCCSHLKVLSC